MGHFRTVTRWCLNFETVFTLQIWVESLKVSFHYFEKLFILFYFFSYWMFCFDLTVFFLSSAITAQPRKNKRYQIFFKQQSLFLLLTATYMSPILNKVRHLDRFQILKGCVIKFWNLAKKKLKHFASTGFSCNFNFKETSTVILILKIFKEPKSYLKVSKMSRSQNDCHLYYNSTCPKGDLCSFRHEPAAKYSGTICKFWIQSVCQTPNCSFRYFTGTIHYVTKNPI